MDLADDYAIELEIEDEEDTELEAHPSYGDCNDPAAPSMVVRLPEAPLATFAAQPSKTSPGPRREARAASIDRDAPHGLLIKRAAGVCDLPSQHPKKQHTGGGAALRLPCREVGERIGQASSQDERVNPYPQPAPKPRIPGPAGALLEAQRRGLRVLNLDGLGCSQRADGIDSSNTISQELAALNQYDPDFQTEAWRQGRRIAGKSVDSIRSALDLEKSQKLALMVAVVSSLEPTASCGDGFAILKDPSGRIGAGVHKDVLAKHPRLSIGAVLALQKVTVLKVCKAVTQVCITAANVLQVLAPPDPTERPLALDLAHRSSPGSTAATPADPPASPHDPLEWQHGIPGSPQVQETLDQAAQPYPQTRHADGTASPASRHRGGVQMDDDALEIEVDLGEDLASPEVGGKRAASGTAPGIGLGMTAAGNLLGNVDDLLETGLWSP